MDEMAPEEETPMTPGGPVLRANRRPGGDVNRAPVWELAWRTPRMHASSYWYFASRTEAVQAGRALQPLTEWTVRAVRAPRAA